MSTGMIKIFILCYNLGKRTAKQTSYIFHFIRYYNNYDIDFLACIWVCYVNRESFWATLLYLYVHCHLLTWTVFLRCLPPSGSLDSDKSIAFRIITETVRRNSFKYCSCFSLSTSIPVSFHSTLGKVRQRKEWTLKWPTKLKIIKNFPFSLSNSLKQT